MTPVGVIREDAQLLTACPGEQKSRMRRTIMLRVVRSVVVLCMMRGIWSVVRSMVSGA